MYLTSHMVDIAPGQTLDGLLSKSNSEIQISSDEKKFHSTLVEPKYAL